MILSKSIRTITSEQKEKNMQLQREEIKLSLLVNGIIVYRKPYRIF
jgi:hypothetical protein